MQHEIYNIDKNHFKALRVKEVMLQILQIVIDFQTSNFQLVCIFLFFVDHIWQNCGELGSNPWSPYGPDLLLLFEHQFHTMMYVCYWRILKPKSRFFKCIILIMLQLILFLENKFRHSCIFFQKLWNVFWMCTAFQLLFWHIRFKIIELLKMN